MSEDFLCRFYIFIFYFWCIINKLGFACHRAIAIKKCQGIPDWDWCLCVFLSDVCDLTWCNIAKRCVKTSWDCHRSITDRTEFITEQLESAALCWAKRRAQFGSPAGCPHTTMILFFALLTPDWLNPGVPNKVFKMWELWELIIIYRSYWDKESIKYLYFQAYLHECAIYYLTRLILREKKHWAKSWTEALSAHGKSFPS